MQYAKHLVPTVAIAALLAGAGFAAPANASSSTIYAAPDGSGSTCTSVSPCSLNEAKETARSTLSSTGGDVVVELAGGSYRIAEPLTFDAEDGGRNGSTVTWKASAGAQPIITGAEAVTGWTVYDSTKNIWSAPTPVGVDTRNLFVDGIASPRATMSINRSDIDVTATGLNLKTSALADLAKLPQQDRIELRTQNFFTDRYSPVTQISDGKAEMTQPAWNNNNWGYDTVVNPIFNHQVLALENSLSFIDTPGEWYIDPSAGRLYYKPVDGVDPTGSDVELPRLESLISVGGTYDAPTENIRFEGIQFSGTSWLAPSGDNGLASQQSGGFISGARDYYPSDAISSCNFGCPAFERARTTWSQQPAAVQVSAAKNISFAGNRFVNLGQIGLGIGNDANATRSGVGLGAQNISVTGNVFTQLGGGAIMAGGIQADAHHPSRPEMTNSHITIDANTVVKTSVTYTDNAGILSTYVDSATITRNEVSQLPYDGIDIGYGWGVNDPGGSPDYVNRGYYQYNPKYTTPTTFKNNLVANNLVHDIKQVFGDGGSIYSLSASPGTVIRENFIHGVRNTIGLYMDEGSRYITAKDNVIRDVSAYINLNTGGGSNPKDNTIDGTWHMGGAVWGETGGASNTRIINDRPVGNGIWPAEARAIICKSGVPADYRTELNTDPCLQAPEPVSCVVDKACENEDGVILGAALATDHPGYTGRGFVGEMLNTGASSTIRFATQKQGDYTATVRYAAGPNGPSASEDRTMTVSVGSWSTKVTLPKTGSWDTWRTVPITVPLPAGTSDLTIGVQAGDTGWVNLDSTLLTGPTGSPSVDVGVTTSSRCVAGKAVLVVQLENKEATAVDATIETPYGSKKVVKLASKASVSNVFATRSTTAPAGVVKITANLTGSTDMVPMEQSFAAKSCG